LEDLGMGRKIMCVFKQIEQIKYQTKIIHFVYNFAPYMSANFWRCVHAFSPSWNTEFFLVRPFLSTHCRCGGLLSHLITQTHTHTLDRTSLDEGLARRRYLYLHNTQYSQEANNHDSDRFRTRNPRKRAAVNPRLRPHGHRHLLLL